LDLDAGLSQGLPNGHGHGHCTRRIAMKTDGLRGDGYLYTIYRLDSAGGQHLHHALRYHRRVMKQRIWL